MRSIDLIFIIALGIAIGSILGKLWSVSPSGLVLYQIVVVCLVWLALRSAITGLNKLWQYISAQPFMSLDYWYTGSTPGPMRMPPRRRSRTDGGHGAHAAHGAQGAQGAHGTNGAIRTPEPGGNSTLDNFLRNLDQH